MPQKIVLIDDTADHLELLAEFVGELRPSASIYQVCDGRELPRYLEEGQVDLVMVDLMMPSISGFDLVRQVREEGRWPNLPIVAVSALRKAEQQCELQQAGFSDYLFKPYEVEELVRVLDRHLPG
jgi:two-component system, sensor histidine kinase SagS